MDRAVIKDKTREWLRRYIPAEVLGTIGALIAAWVVYGQTHSFVAAAGAGWVGEGIGFFGYFVTTELVQNGRKYSQYDPFKRVFLAIGAAGTNLLVEFLPAELLDNLVIRPYAMYITPQYIHPYPVGFLIGKFGSDIIFYAIAAVGYEARKRWLHR